MRRLLEASYWSIHLLIEWLAQDVMAQLPPPEDATIFVRGKPHERLSSLFPEASELRAIKQTLLFYASLAKRPVPNWYAHNPLWKLVYVFLYIALLLLVFSGTMMEQHPVVMGFYLPTVHSFWADVVLLFMLFMRAFRLFLFL